MTTFSPDAILFILFQMEKLFLPEGLGGVITVCVLFSGGKTNNYFVWALPPIAR